MDSLLTPIMLFRNDSAGGGMSDKNQVIEECQKVGEDEVRLRIKQGIYNRIKRTYAEEWLESQARLRSEASSSEQMRVTRSAKNAAWAAAIAAMVAAIAAVFMAYLASHPPR